MKKFFLIIVLLFLYSNANANVITYDRPIFKDIEKYLLKVNIEPWYKPQSKDRIGVYTNYITTWVDTLTAQKFCNLKWQTYINHFLEPQAVQKNAVLYYPLQQTWWRYDVDITRFNSIVCNTNTTWSGTTWSGTTWSGASAFVINNINKDPGINKPVFDNATIIEIYKYEALMMIFILMYTFIMRIMWRAKREPFMWL